MMRPLIGGDARGNRREKTTAEVGTLGTLRPAGCGPQWVAPRQLDALRPGSDTRAPELDTGSGVGEAQRNPGGVVLHPAP